MHTREDFLSLRREIIDRQFSRLNAMQREAVYHTEGAVLILAGAGSGKTTVIVNRIAYLLRFGNAYLSPEVPFGGDSDEDYRLLAAFDAGAPLEPAEAERAERLLAVGAPPAWSVLAITFTNKAAAELKERLAKMLGEQAEEIWASTFHSSCVRILRREITALGGHYTSSFTIYDSDDSRRVIKECMKELNIDDKQLPPRSVQNMISAAKDKLLTPEAFAAGAGSEVRLTQVAKIFRAYQTRLENANALDFDDIIALTVRLLETCPDVLEKYQRRFRYILVDEYQDTNLAQFRLVSLLAGAHGNLCVVGDDDQSIYKFRGATIENILQFDKTFPGARVIRLEQNYRSTERILNAANDVIANNRGRRGKTLWTDNRGGAAITEYCGENERDEAYFIAASILQGVTKENRKLRDFAVLYRANAQSNIIETTLAKMGIAYRIIGGHRFYDRKEIKDALAYLSVIHNPADDVRLTRIINEPKRQIGVATLETARALAVQRGCSLFEIISHAGEFDSLSRAATKLTAFTGMIESLRAERESVPLHELYTHMLERTGYMDMYRAENTPEAADRIDNLSELLSSIESFEEENDEATLGAFLEEVSLMTDIDNYDAAADTVTLMTIHAAKGLEFPVVFLAGMEEGVFPGRQVMFEPEEIEEERRLAYVGITRAKEKLYLTRAAVRTLYGQTLPNRASRFVAEINPALLEYQGVAQRSDRTAYGGAGYGSGGGYGARGTARAGAVQTTRAASTPAAEGAKKLFSQQKKPPVQVAPGDRVRHKAFGGGTVRAVRPMGGDMLVEVQFDSVGTKKLMANFAGLEKE